MKIRTTFLLLVAFLALNSNVFSQDRNFYIFLCLGQSNMEGNAKIPEQDKMMNDHRFQILSTLNCPDLGRTKGCWYPAVPPLCRCNTGLTPADYFGRTMIASLPKTIRIGIINVAVGGCKIELFDKDNYQSYVATAPSWMTNTINQYDGNPYARLVEMAKVAQKTGVVKGILIHQGESNTGDVTWPVKVKGVYGNLIKDLKLNPKSVPLLAGELVQADQGGKCASMNAIIATLPHIIPNSYVISSKGCTAAKDSLHFDAEGYHTLGKRYAIQMLSLLGYKNIEGK